MANPTEKPTHHSLPLVQWLKKKEPLSQAEILQFLQDNKGRLEKSLKAIHNSDVFYRLSNRLFSFISWLAEKMDKVKTLALNILLTIPAPAFFKNTLTTLTNIFDFKGLVEFFRTKIYSLKRAPHNAKVVQLMEDVVQKASVQGLDVRKHFPHIVDKLKARKNQLLQHSFFGEFSKSLLERLLAIPFKFNRSLSPVLADSTLWHKFFVFLENKNIKDLILVGDDSQQVSFKHDSKNALASSQVVRTLYEASVLKAAGHRLFIIGHHEGYLGPYFVRSVLRKLGFDNLTANCNTVVGPRMFSNLVLKSGASNVGNLFLTLPSKKTSQVKDLPLEDALQKNARRTQFLIKMPDAGLKLMEGMGYQAFMDNVVNFEESRFNVAADALLQAEKESLISYLQAKDVTNTLAELDETDYNLFKKVMHEPFLLFPEGSRSYTDKQGHVTMKYVNPRFMEAYLRPGDVILPVNLVGGSDITNGWRLSPANLGLSVGKPYEVSASMIENYQVEGLNVMRTIAKLPNIKNVTFNDGIQAGNKAGLTGLS